MQFFSSSDFTAGWIIGDFVPTLFRTRDFEVAVKFFAKGDREPSHYQRKSTEISVVMFGSCRISNVELNQGDGLLIEPGEAAEFEALTDTGLVAIKFPSLPQDKVISNL